MITPKIFIDQKSKLYGTVIRLCLEYTTMKEAKENCRLLNQAFRHARHEPVRSTPMCGHTIKTILAELT